MSRNNPKPWEKHKQSSYRIAQFSQNKHILIVCEGQTEKEYFNSFDVTSLNVICEDTKGRTKRQLVDFCSKKVAEYKNIKIRFDEIWCVFDMDIKRGESEFADFDNAITSAHSKGYKVAYSNDAFELWFYLHYNYTDSQHLRTFYYEQLSVFWRYNYEKLGKGMKYCRENYDKLKTSDNSSQEQAIIRARKLHEDKNDLTYSKQNPVTTVYLLVVELNKYLKGSRHS